MAGILIKNLTTEGIQNPWDKLLHTAALQSFQRSGRKEAERGTHQAVHGSKPLCLRPLQLPLDGERTIWILCKHTKWNITGLHAAGNSFQLHYTPNGSNLLLEYNYLMTHFLIWTPQHPLPRTAWEHGEEGSEHKADLVLPVGGCEKYGSAKNTKSVQPVLHTTDVDKH